MLFVVFLSLILGSSNARGEVRSYIDKSSAGWAFKKNDVAFVVAQKDCTIQWNAVEMKEPAGRKSLYVKRTCSLPFPEQAEIHKVSTHRALALPPRAASRRGLCTGSFTAYSCWFL